MAFGLQFGRRQSDEPGRAGNLRDGALHLLQLGPGITVHLIGVRPWWASMY
jgi:hypothetical protein